jgi:hypothetical protein
MPLIKAGSQLSDIYQTNGKPPKNIGSDIGHKKQNPLQQANLSNGVIKYL